MVKEEEIDKAHEKEKLIQSVYETNFKRNTFAGFLGPLIFLCFTIFDYLIGETHWFLFLLLRVSLFSYAILFFGLRKTTWYLDHHIKVISSILFFMFMAMTYITFYSDFRLIQIAGVAITFFLYPLIFIGQLRYSLPAVLGSLITVYLFIPWLEELEPTTRMGLIFFYLTSIVVSLLSLYMKFEAAMENEEVKLKLEKREAELDYSNEERKKLIRVLSHDLSNSLALLKGNIFLLGRNLKKSVDPERLHHIHQKLEKAMLFQQEIIEHVRVNEALCDGKIQVKNEYVLVRELFEKTRVIFEERLEKKNIELIIELGADDIAFIGDEVAFRNHVLNNILSNAIKFSHCGSSITLKAYELDGQTVEIAVQDQGIGMSFEQTDNLFSPKNTYSRLGTQGEMGTGFGMPLVKSYLELMNGLLHVESIEEAKDKSGFTSIYLRLKNARNLNYQAG